MERGIFSFNFPRDRFRQVSSDEPNAVIAWEVDFPGGFIGDAIARPALHRGFW